MIGFCLLTLIALTTEQHTIEIEGQSLSGSTIYKGKHNTGIRVSELKHSINQYMNPSISEPRYKFKFWLWVDFPFSKFVSTDECIVLNPEWPHLGDIQDVERHRLKGNSKLIEAMVQAYRFDSRSVYIATQEMVNYFIEEILEYFESPILTQIFDEEIQTLVGRKIDVTLHEWYPNRNFQFEIEIGIDQSKKKDMKIVSDGNILEDHDSIDESLTVNVILEKKYRFQFLICVDFQSNRWVSVDEYIELFPNGHRKYDAREAQQIEAVLLKGESTLIEAMLLSKPRSLRSIQSRERIENEIRTGFLKFSISLDPLFDRKIQDLVGKKIYFDYGSSEQFSAQFEICEHV